VAVSTTGAFAGEEVVVYDTVHYDNHGRIYNQNDATVGINYGQIESNDGNVIAFDQTIARYVRHWAGRSTQNTGVHFLELDIYGIAAPQFSTCAVTLHEHYQLQTGFAIAGAGAPNPCFDENHPKWRSSNSLFYDDVHECEDMCDADKHCIGFVDNIGTANPYCVFKSSSASIHADPAKETHLKDDTVDFETHMSASRGRHCECAHITYVPDDGAPITDCGDLEDGATCSDGNAVTLSDSCHAGVCKSTAWTQTENTQCAGFLAMNHNLVTLAQAEEACAADPTCGGFSDLYCNGMHPGSVDHYALCDSTGMVADTHGTCAYPKPGPGGGGH